MGGWSCDFRPIENREFSKKRHKTVILYRSEPNFLLNKRSDPALSFEIVDTDIWHLQPPIWEKKGKNID